MTFFIHLTIRQFVFLVGLTLATFHALAGETELYDTVLLGGRVIDPDSGVDAVRNVGIKNGSIAIITNQGIKGKTSVDVSGLVVAPGFIDLHAHGQDNVSNELQVQDGVTTALDLEAGAWPIPEFYEKRQGKSRLNYGTSVSHLAARAATKLGIDVGHLPTHDYNAPWHKRLLSKLFEPFIDKKRVTHDAATEEEIEEIVSKVKQGLDDGGLGIGFLMGYMPGAAENEFRQLFELAGSRKVVGSVHLADADDMYDTSPIKSIIALARETNAPLHILHLHSTARQNIDIYQELIDAAIQKGQDITAEAYPYEYGSTFIQSALFDEGFQHRLGVNYEDMIWPATGERLTEESFGRYREQGGLFVFKITPSDTIDKTISHPDIIIASDGQPMFKEGLQHPRGAGTYARVLGLFVREQQKLDLMSAIRKMTLLPAKRLESFVPAMSKKGRLQIGADADITIFNAGTVGDQSTYTKPRLVSAGIPHVLVDGQFVVRDSMLVKDAYPGKAILAKLKSN